MTLLASLLLIAVGAGAAHAACAARTFTTDDGNLTIGGQAGHISGYHSTSTQSTCLDVNVYNVSGSDDYAMQYYESGWRTGSAGRRFLAAGNVSPWWVAISNLGSDNRFRAWSDDFNRTVRTYD